jgi:hypothetical protein
MRAPAAAVHPNSGHFGARAQLANPESTTMGRNGADSIGVMDSGFATFVAPRNDRYAAGKR